MIRISFLLISIALSVSALGQPVISSVNGDFSEGETATILGAGFGENTVAAGVGGENQNGDVNIDNTQAKVFISNSPRWSEAEPTQDEIQIPVSWVPTQIVITVNPGTFSPDDEVYLYIVDAEGKINSGGYRVEINSVQGTDDNGMPGKPGTPQLVPIDSTPR